VSELVAVHLYGPLADEFGALHRFAVRDPREAARALCANYPRFEAAFHKHGPYYVIVDGELREHEAAALLPAMREVHFRPVAEGNAFLGAALVGAIIPSLAGTTAATIIGGLLFTGLMIGISFLLRPKPPSEEEEKKNENYAFTGPENVTEQGVAVPLIYGQVFAGSVVVSAGLEVAELPAST
jgi:predicted phage tail protein